MNKLCYFNFKKLVIKILRNNLKYESYNKILITKLIYKDNIVFF